MVCKDVCIFESDTLTMAIPVVDAPRPGTNPAAHALLAQAESRVPVDATEGAFEWKAREEGIELTVPQAKAVQFFPGVECAELSHPIEDAEAEGSTLYLRFKDADRDERRLAGVLQIEASDSGRRWFEIDMTTGRESGGP